MLPVACCFTLILSIHKESVWVTPLCIYFLFCDKLFAAIEIQMKGTVKLKSEKQQTTDSFNCFVLFSTFSCTCFFFSFFFFFSFSFFLFAYALFRVFCCVCFALLVSSVCFLLRLFPSGLLTHS